MTMTAQVLAMTMTAQNLKPHTNQAVIAALRTFVKPDRFERQKRILCQRNTYAILQSTLGGEYMVKRINMAVMLSCTWFTILSRVLYLHCRAREAGCLLCFPVLLLLYYFVYLVYAQSKDRSWECKWPTQHCRYIELRQCTVTCTRWTTIVYLQNVYIYLSNVVKRV